MKIRISAWYSYRSDDAGRKESRRGCRESQVHQGGVRRQIGGEGLGRAALAAPHQDDQTLENYHGKLQESGICRDFQNNEPRGAKGNKLGNVWVFVQVIQRQTRIETQLYKTQSLPNLFLSAPLAINTCAAMVTVLSQQNLTTRPLAPRL